MRHLRSASLASSALLALAIVGCGQSGGGSSAGLMTTAAATTTTTTPRPATTTTTAPVPSAALPAVPVPPPAPKAPSNAYLASMLLGEVQVLDLNQPAVLTRVAAGKGPTAVAVNGTYAYVANGISQNVNVIDRLANQSVATIDVSRIPVSGIGAIDNLVKQVVRPTGIAVTPNGQKAYTANLLNVTSIDLVNRQPGKSIFTLNVGAILANGLGGIGQGLQAFLQAPFEGLGAARVAASADRAFATNMVTNNVTVIATASDSSIAHTKVGKLPFGLALANGKVYVACVLSGEIWVLDAATGLVKTSFKSGMMPFDVAASPKGDKVYVANLAGGDITVIDTAADAPVATLPAGLPLLAILQQLGVPVPAGGQAGLMGAVNAFIAAFLGGPNGAAGQPGAGAGNLAAVLGALLNQNGGAGGQAGGLVAPNALVNALIAGLLGALGVNQQALQGMALPGLGIAGIAVDATGDHVLCANWFMGSLTITDVNTKDVKGLLPGTSGIGPAAIATSP